MDRAKRREIGKFADRLRHTLDLSLPVNPEQAVHNLNGQIRYVDPLELGEAEAKIIKTSEATEHKFEILIDRTKSTNRRRFSIAHEIGHLFLHMGYLIEPEKWATTPDFEDSAYFRNGSGEQEFEAHEFAAAFLMPEEDFRSCARSSMDLGEVARQFDVSVDAALTRGRWLDIYAWNS